MAAKHSAAEDAGTDTWCPGSSSPNRNDRRRAPDLNATARCFYSVEGRGKEGMSVCVRIKIQVEAILRT